MEFYDFPLREFEYVSLTYDLAVSGTCFAQIKRHRMATLTAQKYNPVLGVTVPPSIEEIGARREFRVQLVRYTNSTVFSKTTVHSRIECILGRRPGSLPGRGIIPFPARCFGCTEPGRRFCIRHFRYNPKQAKARCFEDSFAGHVKNGHSSFVG